MIDKYLDDLESRIDATVETGLLGQWRRFWDGEVSEGIFTAQRRKAIAAQVDWPAVRVNAALNDYEQMALQQFGLCSQMVADGDGQLLCVRCNYGSSILPSLFGAEMFVMADELDTLPTSRPLAGGADAIKALLDRGAPDLKSGQGASVFAMAERFMAIREQYPKMREFVHLYHPDLQGPMDVCEVLWGCGIFVELVDKPELVKGLLELITETYIRFMVEWEKIVPGTTDGYSAHWSMMHGGRIMLRDDSAMNLSPSMFDEFVRPYDQKLLAELGGGGLHFCGRGDHYIGGASTMGGLTAIAMSQPECNDMEVIYANTVDKGIKLIGFEREAAEAALARGRDLHGNVHSW